MVGLPLGIRVGDDERQVTPAQLQNADYREQLTCQLCAGSMPSFDLQHLLEWSEAECETVLTFIHGLQISYVVVANGSERSDLLSSVLVCLAEDDGFVRRSRGVHAAVVAARIAHPAAHQWPVACDQIYSRLCELGITSFTKKQIKEMVKQRLANHQADVLAAEEYILVSEVLPDAPVSCEAIVPDGWLVSEAGITKDEDKCPVPITAPVLIARRFMDRDTGAEQVGVTWPRDGAWHEEIVPRKIIADSRAILVLAEHGAPVNSGNASTVVQYLAAYEACNLESIPTLRVTQQLGWQGDDGFLWGHTLIRNEERVPESMAEQQDNAGVQPDIVFRGADEGDNQLAAGFSAAGTLNGWLEAVAPLADYPRAQFVLYASVVPPLLQIIGAYNFIVSLSGATSQGKTTTQRVAASCWGCPDERSSGSTLHTWDATRVFIECACATQSDMPLILDDTKRAKKSEDIAQTLYDVAAGRGRGRGSMDGIRGVKTFRTVMISSGEAPITSFSRDSGTRPRTLEIWGSPFGEPDAQSAQLVRNINAGVVRNYGHIGPHFVQFIIDNRNRWDAWRQQYADLCARYSHLAGDNSVGARMAAHAAAIRLAATLLHEAVDMPWEDRDIVAELFPEIAAVCEEADEAAVAMEYVLSWAHGHTAEFMGTGGSSGHEPHGGWAGRWDVAQGDYWTWLGILPHRLNEILTAGNFNPKAIRNHWYQRGWLATSDGKRTLRQRMGHSNTYLVAIRRKVIEQFEPGGDTVPFPRATGCQQQRA